MNESNPNEDKSRRFGFRIYAEWVYKGKHGKQRREQKHVIDTTNQDDNNEKKRLSFEEYRSAENQLKSADAAGIIALIIFVIILAALMFGSGFAN